MTDESNKPLDELEALRFFCSKHMQAEAWLDSEPLFEALRQRLFPESGLTDAEKIKRLADKTASLYAEARDACGNLYRGAAERSWAASRTDLFKAVDELAEKVNCTAHPHP